MMGNVRKTSMPDPNLPDSLDEALALIESQRAEIVALNREIELLKQHSSLAAVSRSSTFLLQRFSVRRLLGRAFRTGRTQSPIQMLEQSPFFDVEHYAAQLEGTKSFRSARHAVRHYLSVGAAAGLNPSAAFDTRWYLSKYPDVGSSGHNPLVHFVLYGLEEGRLPGPAGLTDEYFVRKEPTRSQELRLKAWGGFPNLALPALARLADDHLSMQAAWALAGWHYAHGDFEAALYRVGHYEQLGNEGLNKRALVGLAKCYAQLGLREDARLLVDRGRAAGLNTADFPYIAANADILEGNLSKGILAFNEVYTRVGLSPVEVGSGVHSTDSPLSLLDASGVPPVNLNQPRVSVIIPAYNAANTLPIALGSLLKQSWENLEVIVVDDCSQDNTEEVVQAFAEKDARIRYLRNEENLGAYPSRNRGMVQATGEFVTVHDSDDWSHPQKIERQVHPLIVDASKVATYSAWVRVTQDMLFVGPWLLSEHFIEKNHSSLLVRSGVLREVGLWDSVNVAGDTEFLWRLETQYGAEAILAVLPTTPLSLALADDNSLTRTKASHVKTIHYGLRRLYREAASWWHRRSGVAVEVTQKWFQGTDHSRCLWV